MLDAEDGLRQTTEAEDRLHAALEEVLGNRDQIREQTRKLGYSPNGYRDRHVVKRQFMDALGEFVAEKVREALAAQK